MNRSTSGPGRRSGGRRGGGSSSPAGGGSKKWSCGLVLLALAALPTVLAAAADVVWR